MIATIKVIQYNLSLLSYMIYFELIKIIKMSYNASYSDSTKQLLIVDDFLVNSQTSLDLVKKNIQDMMEPNHFIGLHLVYK